MTTGTCLTCARHGAVEEHHVGGWRNDPTLTVRLCTPCHKVVTSWQHAAGVNLLAGPRSEVDVARAILVGCAHLYELFLARHPDLYDQGSSRVQRVGRAVSMGLDMLADPEREGRWTPDAARARVHDIHAVRRRAQDALVDLQRFLTTLEHLLSGGVLEGGALGAVARLLRGDPAIGSLLDLLATIGVLLTTTFDLSSRARSVAAGLDSASEPDAALAVAVGAVALRLIMNLQAAQRGRAG